MIELERTFLAKKLPDEIKDCPKNEITDTYYPKDAEHPSLRLRKEGDIYTLVKKSPINENDKSIQKEQIIVLTKAEFDTFTSLEGKTLRKVRYSFVYNGVRTEVDVFKDALEGLVLIDFEFSDRNEKESFRMPEFCLADVTQEEFTAGGMLCGKSYEEINEKLDKFGYVKI